MAPPIFQLPPPFPRSPCLGLLGSIACGCGETSTPPAIHAVRPGLFRFLTNRILHTLSNMRDNAATLARSCLPVGKILPLQALLRPSVAYTAHLMRYCNELQLQLIVGIRGNTIEAPR